MASVVNLFVDQGSDYTLTLTVKDDDGNATDLTGYAVEAYFQKWTGATQVIESTSNPDGQEEQAKTDDDVVDAEFEDIGKK